MTKLEKPLTRQTEILDSQGRELTVTMQPSTQGGEILLHWNRDKKKERDKTFQLKDLSKGDTTGPKPKGWGTWVPIEQIQSQLSIAPGVDLETARLLMGVMQRAALMQEWVAEDTELEFDEFLTERGRKDLVHLPCDEERPAFVESAEKVKEIQKKLNPHTQKKKK